METTLVSPDNNQTLKTTSNNNSKIIKSVHLLGAAINNMSIVNNISFVNATEHLVNNSPQLPVFFVQFCYFWLLQV
ncbi:MAG TPA: hypothetical protein VFY64_10370 [Nitrososphaeraceae archaeon]|nr:hypothetical protein [Nitrososphaeraceae archaeon]